MKIYQSLQFFSGFFLFSLWASMSKSEKNSPSPGQLERKTRCNHTIGTENVTVDKHHIVTSQTVLNSLAKHMQATRQVSPTHNYLKLKDKHGVWDCKMS